MIKTDIHIQEHMQKYWMMLGKLFRVIIFIFLVITDLHLLAPLSSVEQTAHLPSFVQRAQVFCRKSYFPDHTFFQLQQKRFILSQCFSESPSLLFACSYRFFFQCCQCIYRCSIWRRMKSTPYFLNPVIIYFSASSFNFFIKNKLVFPSRFRKTILDYHLNRRPNFG